MENIIFDIGNVLLRFDPETYLLKKYDQETTYQLMTIIFSSDDWELLDLGNMSTKDVIYHLINEYPKYQREIKEVLEDWSTMLEPIMENVKLLPRLKEKGYHLYLLSNFHDEAFHKVTQKYDFFNLFDGGVISYEIHQIKPYHQMYDTLLQRYHLNPLKSIFIDDMYANTIAASRYDIDTIWLNYGTSLEEAFRKKKIL